MRSPETYRAARKAARHAGEEPAVLKFSPVDLARIKLRPVPVRPRLPKPKRLALQQARAMRRANKKPFGASLPALLAPLAKRAQPGQGRCRLGIDSSLRKVMRRLRRFGDAERMM